MIDFLEKPRKVWSFQKLVDCVLIVGIVTTSVTSTGFAGLDWKLSRIITAIYDKIAEVNKVSILLSTL